MKKVEAKVLNKIRRPVITKLWTLNVSQRISTVLKIAVLIKTYLKNQPKSLIFCFPLNIVDLFPV